MSHILVSFCKFSHLLVRGPIKGLSPNEAIFDTFFIEMHHYVIQNGSAPGEKFLESIFEFSQLLIRGLIKGLSPN